MKNNKNLVLALITLCVVASIFFYFFRGSSSEKTQSTNQSKNNSIREASDSKKSTKSNEVIKARPKDPTKSLQLFGENLKELISGEKDIDGLMQELESLGLEPNRVSDTNQYTGNMTIVRTGKTLPGTRYFHAQFFSDDNGGNQLQHLSFDYSGGAGEIGRVGSMLAKTMNLSTPAEVSREGYRMYRIGDSHILWAKVIDREDYNDLKSDPYKAYSSDDIGKVIRIAVEQEIH